ncbi:MAG: hypothetical protein ACJ796_07480 [Gemmatimonadaceae bacterium]
MHVSMLVRRCSALLVVLVAASACSDAPMAPRATERPAFDIQALQPLDSRGSSQSGSLSGQASDDNVATLTIDPNVSRTYAFGQNWIYFPARSICDPNTSGYGPGTWDLPCAPITRPLTVTVHWSAKGGYSYAKFTPELRFVPADERSVFRWVVLSLHSNRRLHELNAYNILYCSADEKSVDESLADPTLKAWLDPLHNSVVRRVKHFSGYMVAAGFSARGDMGGLDASY